MNLGGWLSQATDGDKLNAVMYYDLAYGGTGYKDYAKGLNYTKLKVKLCFQLSPAKRGRTLSVSQANGKGYRIIRQNV